MFTYLSDSFTKAGQLLRIGRPFLFCSTLALVLAFSGVRAESTDFRATNHADWALQLTPYFWAASLDGNISPFRRGPTIGIAKPFSKVIRDVNAGGFINVWGRWDRLVLSGDMMYINTSDSRHTGMLPPLPIPGLGTIPSGGKLGAKVDTKQLSATLMGGYRLVDTPQFTLDALAGMRYWHISNKVTLNGSLGGKQGAVRYSERFSWVDPLVGVRAFLPLTPAWSLQGQADMGGFGAGSDFTWSVQATVNYDINDRLSASLGYKVLDVDYDRRGHVYDARLSGPILGITYRF